MLEKEKEREHGADAFRKRLEKKSKDRDFVNRVRRDIEESSELSPEKALTTLGD